ncbi:MAG: DNA-directed RNA polymerase subunit omega [Bacteroidales bacterium]
MEISKNVPTNTITRDLSKLAKPTGNIYESTIIIAKRSNQIAAELKQELKQKLEEFSSFADTLEETFENREQIEISRYYERLPKASLLAINEFEEDKIQVRKIEG